MQKTVWGACLIIIALCAECGTIKAQETIAPENLPGALPSVLGSAAISSSSEVKLTSGTYAIFHTSEGDFIATLRPDWAPVAFNNFVALATGQKRWRHPVTLEETTRPLYSNTTIYRIVPNAMIAGGDPIGRGEADSGTQLPLETGEAEARFDKPGMLAMDNSGDKVSGSRWFISLRPFPERNGVYSIFGQVIGGADLIQKISLKPVKRPQLPLDPVMVYFIEIVRIPPGRLALGEFKMVEGMHVLRIDPNFQDAPTAADEPAEDLKVTSEDESRETTSTGNGAKR